MTAGETRLGWDENMVMVRARAKIATGRVLFSHKFIRQHRRLTQQKRRREM